MFWKFIPDFYFWFIFESTENVGRPYPASSIMIFYLLYPPLNEEELNELLIRGECYKRFTFLVPSKNRYATIQPKTENKSITPVLGALVASVNI